jgi:hypothetical protein
MQEESTWTSGMRGRYLYAIVPGPEKKVFGPLGINGGRVYTIPNGEIAAVVSDFPKQKIRPERRHFAAHQMVLRQVMESSDLLPMSFGIVSGSPEAVRGILSRNRQAILTQLKRVAGKVEMGLRVTWDVPNIFQYMINIHPELALARERLVGSPHGPTHEEKISVGQMFEELLEADRERHTRQVEQVLGPGCFEIKRNPCRDELHVMNLACLVGRNSVADFEEAVLDAAGFFDDNFTFDYNGPWAPHNFVDIEVDV